jgi:hypothetical protein
MQSSSRLPGEFLGRPGRRRGRPCRPPAEPRTGRGNPTLPTAPGCRRRECSPPARRRRHPRHRRRPEGTPGRNTKRAYGFPGSGGLGRGEGSARRVPSCRRRLELHHRQRIRLKDRRRAAKPLDFRTCHSIDRWWRNTISLEVVPDRPGPYRLQALLLDGDLVMAEPATLGTDGARRRTQRAPCPRVIVRLPATWPWAAALSRTFIRLRALPLRRC